MRSGFLTAPMVGGQSWLAHASVLSGLSIDNQGRYRALLASPRRTLLHLAREAGWQTAAVMPAITLAWPEAGYFGYDRVLAAADLGYRGLPFDWVTMPDQFTLASFERQLLAPAPRPPVFAEIALISSHAPWTPIPPLLPWDALGDGAVFDAATPPPATRRSVVWRDEDRVRDQYRRSLDYVLRVVGGFAARRAADAAAVRRPRRPSARGLRLGGHRQPRRADPRHRPARGAGAPRRLGLDPGHDPGPATPRPGGWTRFRDRFLAAFGTGTAPAVAGRRGALRRPDFTVARRVLIPFQ